MTRQRPIPIKQLHQIRQPTPVNYKLVSKPKLERQPETRQPAARPPKAMRPQPIITRVNQKQTNVSYIQPRPVTPQWADRIRRLYGIGRGRILVILGNGPSLSEVQIECLQAHPRIDMMTINHPDARVWPTKYWAFCDMSQYRRHPEHWRDFAGTIITSTSVGYTKEVAGNDKKNVVYIRNLGGKGFSTDLINGTYVGRSTVFANMQTAIWMGYDKVYIFGVDMAAAPDGRAWFYGINLDVLPEDRLKRFGLDAEYYEHAASIMSQESRSKFVFCSNYNPWSFIARFARLDHTTAVNTILASL